MRHPLGSDHSSLGLFGQSLAGVVRAWVVGVALAAEPLAEAKSEVLQLLEDYRQALEQKDLDRMTQMYEAFSDRQREALRTYLDNALNLEVEITDVQVDSHDGRVAVSFTRRDKFIDRATGKQTRLEVRLTKIFVREGGKWIIAAGA